MGTNSYVTVASGVPENPKPVNFSLVKQMKYSQIHQMNEKAQAPK